MATILLKSLRGSHVKIKKPCVQLFLSTVVSEKSALKNSIPHYVYFHESFSDENEKFQLIQDLKIHENFVSEVEENELLREVEPILKRLRYEDNHWDNAITNYRETERPKWSSDNNKILDRVKKLAFDSNTVPLKYVHVLDLEEKGVIKPHIDSVKFCGTTIAGISLLTDSVMRLVHDNDQDKVFDILLKRRSLYIMTGIARYNYKHEILGNDNSQFNGKTVKKGRRISIICRNEP